MKDIKIFYYTSASNFGIEHCKSNTEVNNFLEGYTKCNPTMRFFEIKYIRGSGIGTLARHINQCTSLSAYLVARNGMLLNEMMDYIKLYNFKELKFIPPKPVLKVETTQEAIDKLLNVIQVVQGLNINQESKDITIRDMNARIKLLQNKM